MKRIEHPTPATSVHRAVSCRGGGRASRRRSALAGALAAALLCSAQVAAADATADTNLEQWLLRRLNQPTDRELAHERKGHVYIYDGLTDREVDHALNAHFDRIEHMMFVGTRKTAPSNAADGNAGTESPGCM